MGITSTNVNSGVSSSAIFDTDAPEGNTTNDIIAHDTAHETGHIVDFLSGSAKKNRLRLVIFRTH